MANPAPKRRIGPYLGALAVVVFLGLLTYAYLQVQANIATEDANTPEDSQGSD